MKKGPKCLNKYSHMSKNVSKYGKRCQNSSILFLIVSECSNAGPYIYKNLFQNMFFSRVYKVYRKTRTCVCLWLRARMCCLLTCCLVVVLHSLRVRLGHLREFLVPIPCVTYPTSTKSIYFLAYTQGPGSITHPCFILKSSRELDESIYFLID